MSSLINAGVTIVYGLLVLTACGCLLALFALWGQLGLAWLRYRRTVRRAERSVPDLNRRPLP